MKRLVKAVLKALWRWLLPMRRPLMRKFEATIGQNLRLTDERIAVRTRLHLNHLVAELVRLERELESLELLAAEMPRERRASTRAVEPVALERARQIAAERKKAG